VDHAWGYGSEQRLREENQDSFGVFDFPDYALAIVCDGMGGHVGGAQASSLAVRTIHDALRELQDKPLPEALEEALTRTNLVIYEAARKNHRLMGMGTTVVVAAVQDGQAYLAHVGDSRAYLVREGQVTQLTRDHTMVNLFVDAELLTPEDAATHPEAHVLSRSLGVERQVDVDVSEPIELGADDTLVLCSDGVHGVVTDWELSNVDWGAPHEGIRHLLDIVTTREGDDNATAVALMMGTSFEDVPPTPVPEPKRFDDSPMGGGLTAVPVDDDNTFDSSPSYRGTPDSGGASYVVYEDHPIIDDGSEGSEVSVETEAAPPKPSNDKSAPAPIAQGDQSKKKAEPPKPADKPQKKAAAKKSRGGASRLIPVIVGAGVVAFGVLGLVLVAASQLAGGDEETDEEPVAQLQVNNPGEADQAQAEPSPAPAAQQAPEPAPEPVEEDVPLFAPELPAAPRRLPHRPTRYTQPPPGGQVQWVSVQAARNKQCARALSEVQRGMSTSIDYAALYRGAWLCFVDTHQRPLEQASVETWEDFIYVLPHFEGAPEERRAQLEEDPTLEEVPEWYRPAIDGIEYRLERFGESTDNDRLVDVLNDQFGEPTVADQLAKDVHMVALAAAGLARVPEPNERVVNWWARRVFVATKAMHGRAGRAIERHRPELIPVIRDLLREATSPRTLDDGTVVEVPEPVLEAREVALGNQPPPTEKKKAEPVYVPPKEPELSDLEDDVGPTEIRRPGNPNFGND